MKRNIEWKEKTEDGVRRMVRVLFPGKGQVKWQFKRSDEERWDYDTPASSADWATLLEKVENLYQRNRCARRDLEAITALKEKHQDD